MLPFIIREHGGKPHQIGFGSNGGEYVGQYRKYADCARSGPDKLPEFKWEPIHGPVITHVKNGQPLTPQGKRALERWASSRGAKQ